MNPLYYYYGLTTLSILGTVSVMIYRYILDTKNKALRLKLALQKSSEQQQEHAQRKEEEKKNENYKRIIEHTQKKELKSHSSSSPSSHTDSLSQQEIKKLLKQAEVYLGSKNYMESEKILIQILSYDEHQKNALEVLSELYLEQHSYNKSVFFLEKYLEKYIPSAMICNNYALAQLHLKNFNESIRYYSKAIELENHNDIRYANLGHVFIALENFDDAIKCFEEALKISPRRLDYHRHIALCFRRQNAFPECKRWIQRLLELAPYDTESQKELERLEALGY